MRVWFAAAVIAASLAPAAALAQDGRVSPIITTSMQRTCQGESGAHVTFDASGQRSTEPQRFADTRGFRAERAGNGYRFVQSVTQPHGETTLTANVAADGAVSGAMLAGAGFDTSVAASPTPIDVPALAASLAVEIPERLLVNRSFAPGDQYYPPELRDSLISQMTSALGLPFPVTGSINMPFQGQSTIDGHEVWVWEGELTMSGAGLVRDAPVTLQSVSRVRVVHDAATGLVRTYRTAQDINLQIGGQPFLAQTTFDSYVCQIVPQ